MEGEHVNRPGYWEERYVDGDIPWDKGYAAPPLTEFLAANPMRGRVLVPGCGTGHDVRAIAESGAITLGLDLAPRAIAQARAASSAQPNASFSVGDFFALAPSLAETFEWVFEHTLFCAIDPALRPEYAKAVQTVLEPGGRFLAIFFVDIEDPDGPPFPTDNAEIDRLFGPSFEELRRWTPGASYPGREGREQLRLFEKPGG